MGKMRKRTRRGVSLIEVLVVLALLVLGILVIIRLYPSGFFSITSVGNAALADSLGQAAVQTQAQNTANLPESILPVNSTTKDLTLASTADASYDPDDPALLDNARVINNETITVPAATGVTRQSIYIVNYGPIVMPVQPSDVNLPKYLSINSPLWTPTAGVVPSATDPNPSLPQTEIFPRQERFLVDLANKNIAVPYAAYADDLPVAKTTVGTDIASSYEQKMVAMILASDGKTYTQYLDVSPATHRDNGNPYAPFGPDNTHYLPDVYTGPGAAGNSYQGGWFDPTKQYLDATPPGTQSVPPSNVTWRAVLLYRAFQGLANTQPFQNDPYEFTLTSSSINDPNGKPLANVGAISFNPLGAGGAGSSALKARISYLTYSWKILHEDRDIPALNGSDTTATRLTLKNLKRAGDNNPDNSIYSGLIPNSFLSMIALDLDTGLMAGPATPVPDPTAAEGNLWDEDLNGTKLIPPYDLINVSFSTGRVTFQSDSFGDNPAPGNTPKAHRVRIFYVGDADWTVAVQKAPSYYTLSPTVVTGANDPMLQPGQYAVDQSANGTQNLYFPRSDAEKSVEIDGTYLLTSGSGSQLKTFAGTIAIPPVVTTLGTTNYVTVSLTDALLTGGPSASSASQAVTQVNVTAVRGLSVRSVVAWKERDHFKVHSVDTVLNRAQ